ncbi:MAG: hybrid sensor histidine kinase/response regulator [Nautilia sp.]|nr:MAG: hybrid sensor histidine kinase/response regulator [Nautilia sp.]
MDDMQEILEDFLIEAFEMIEQLDQDLVELESNPDDLDLLNKIFRVAHTIKGSGSFLNLDVLTRLTHHMEDVLNKARKGELKITPDIMDVILESVDMMKALLENIRDNGTDVTDDIDIEPVVAKLDAISKGQDISNNEESSNEKSEESESSLADELDISEEDLENMTPEEVEAEIERLLKQRQEEDRRLREEMKKKQQQNSSNNSSQENSEKTDKKSSSNVASNAPTKKEVKKESKSIATKKTTVEQTIRVDVNRLDSLMNLIGELVLSKNRLIKIYNDVEERYEGEHFLDELNQVVSSISIVTTDLQIAVMKTRMLQIGKVFNKFPRVIRDLSRELGKKVNLIIKGEETELDKSIIEEIGDPLMHMIRNSVDHGIEPPEERVKLGKPEVGTVELKAYNEGNQIVIEISDDGRGMDPEVLKQKALEKGLISEKEAEMMSDKEAFMLIFKPGFSTAAKITNVSGRGVGMDVVKTNVEKLNGIIEVDSTPGKGSTFKIKIPLTLAIIQALLVAAQEELFAIPLANVIETVRITLEDISAVEGKSVLRLRDEVLPLVSMSDIFKIEKILGISQYLYVVVLGVGASKVGLIVDALIGQEEIVIKSLGEYLKGIPGIAGATIRGDGKVTLIVDVAALMKLAKETHAHTIVSATISKDKKKKEKPEDYVILIIDDSNTDRKIMRKAIEPLGFTIKEATNGEEALNILKNDSNIDAALVDIEMPKMDGYTLAQEIRKYNRFKNLPLIAVTSRTTKADRVRGVEVGMNEYITKPYTPEYLANVLRRNLKLQ